MTMVQWIDRETEESRNLDLHEINKHQKESERHSAERGSEIGKQRPDASDWPKRISSSRGGSVKDN